MDMAKNVTVHRAEPLRRKPYSDFVTLQVGSNDLNSVTFFFKDDHTARQWLLDGLTQFPIDLSHEREIQPISA